jgi:hypothetical protein
MDAALTREELLETYEHPYARWLPLLYRLNHVGVTAGGATLLVAATGVAAVVGDDGAPGWLVALAQVAAVLALLWVLWVTLGGVRIIRARTREWRAHDRGELARVRERRPHAGEAARDVAHDEYAVAVGDGGHLVTWCFTPLAADEVPGPADVLLVGTPRYAARPVADAPHDARDAALAAEQLAVAQEAAADREAAAAQATRAALVAREEARELAAESASTGAALRSVTGQAPR